eukprot:170417_1
MAFAPFAFPFDGASRAFLDKVKNNVEMKSFLEFCRTVPNRSATDWKLCNKLMGPVEVQLESLDHQQDIYACRLLNNFLHERRLFLATKKKTLARDDDGNWMYSLLFGNYIDMLSVDYPPDLFLPEYIVAFASLGKLSSVTDHQIAAFRMASFKDIFVLMEQPNHTFFRHKSNIGIQQQFIQLVAASVVKDRALATVLFPEKMIWAFDDHSCVFSVTLGAMLVFAYQYVAPLFGTESMGSIQDIVVQHLVAIKKHKSSLKLCVGKVQKMSRLLMSWSKDPHEHGRNLIMHGFEEISNKLAEEEWHEQGCNGNSLFWGQSAKEYMFYVMAKLKYKQKEYRSSQKYFVAAVCRGSSLFVRERMFKYLVDLCCRFGEHQLALKCLETRYKLCYLENGHHIDPLFVRKEYYEMKKDIKRALVMKSCEYCNKSFEKHKLHSCTGCMKAMYCGKSCQKRDWKLKHKDVCSRSWKINYKALQTVIFERL